MQSIGAETQNRIDKSVETIVNQSGLTREKFKTQIGNHIVTEVNLKLEQFNKTIGN